MIRTSALKLTTVSSKTLKYHGLLRAFLYGLLLPLGFAPFHLPGAAILGIALFYTQLQKQRHLYPFFQGLLFGLGYFGLGVSWIFISIHDYGHLNWFLSVLVTFSFLVYIALFSAFMSLVFKKLMTKSLLLNGLLFSSLWIIFEYLRSTLFTGFPWLLLGFGQFDAPIRYLLPVIGIFGVGFITCFAATLLSNSMQQLGSARYLSLGIFVIFVLAPNLIKDKQWSIPSGEPISVGVIQANLSMRDKWDENLFWKVLERYKQGTHKLLGTQLIVMPESAIPLPEHYIHPFINSLHKAAKQAKSAVLLGIPKPTSIDEESYYNALISLGIAKGSYLKQHLVPFGEYIPQSIAKLNKWFGIPDAHLKPGPSNQTLIRIKQHTVATLICYELAYGKLLQNQLPQANWIVSISDDGWFGHSLAMYQQLQMAQVRSLQAARYQVVANNDGLSSVINTQGEIVDLLPAFSSGLLKTTLIPMKGTTPWIYLGDPPIILLIISLFIGIVSIQYYIKRRAIHN